MTHELIETLDRSEALVAEILQDNMKSMSSLLKLHAVRFIQWAVGEGWQTYDGPEKWINLEQGRRVITTFQLYDLWQDRRVKDDKEN